MVNPYSQWLFLVTDSIDPSIFLPTVEDGQNISFLYNASEAGASDSTSSKDEQNDLSCYSYRLLEAYVNALHQVIRSEETRYFQTTEDDWSRSKPSAGDRRNDVFQTLQVGFIQFYLHPLLLFPNSLIVISSSPPKKKCFLQNIWKNTKKCSNWLAWNITAVEIKETKKPTLLDVASWDAAHGLVVYDDFFPHFTGGLRQRVINVTTMEVNYCRSLLPF